MILIVDDKPHHLRAYCMALSFEGFKVKIATTVDECLETIQESENIEALVLDIMFPPGPLSLRETQGGESTGLILLDRIRELAPDLPVLLFSVRIDQDLDWARDANTILVPKDSTSPIELVRIIRDLAQN